MLQLVNLFPAKNCIEATKPPLCISFPEIPTLCNKEDPAALSKFNDANNIIEIAPIAFMRGRTLENCYIILDEAQNTTKIQMKMFLTRLGKNSKMVVVGDNTQIDLISKSDSGLIDAAKKLKNIEDIGFIELDNRDVVRHEVVRKIINAYEEKNRN